jgi:hypothetical protein
MKIFKKINSLFYKSNSKKYKTSGDFFRNASKEEINDLIRKVADKSNKDQMDVLRKAQTLYWN